MFTGAQSTLPVITSREERPWTRVASVYGPSALNHQHKRSSHWLVILYEHIDWYAVFGGRVVVTVSIQQAGTSSVHRKCIKGQCIYSGCNVKVKVVGAVRQASPSRRRRKRPMTKPMTSRWRHRRPAVRPVTWTACGGLAGPVRAAVARCRWEEETPSRDCLKTPPTHTRTHTRFLCPPPTGAVTLIPINPWHRHDLDSQSPEN